MNFQKKLKITSEPRTANITGVGVNAVTLTTLVEVVTAFSFSEKPYFHNRANSSYKLPSILFGFALFLAAVTRVTAVLIKGVLQLINVILEIAPRGILFFLSLINLVFSHFSLSSAEWLTKSKDEEDNSHFCSNDLPLYPLYVQHGFNFYE